MNDNVTPLKAEKFLHNLAKCLSCKHEWQAVVPVGTKWIVCPACSLNCGRLIGPVHYEGDHWHCTCGNDLFRVMPDRTYCPTCGVTCAFK